MSGSNIRFVFLSLVFTCLTTASLTAQLIDHGGVCNCPQCCAQEYQLTGRWSSTATDGGGLAQGDPTTLTWTIVADSTPITPTPSIPSESSDPSDLIATLNSTVGSVAGPVSAQPWFGFFQDSFDRLEAVSGLDYTYVTYDTGADVGASPAGSLGTIADVRIGGHSIDGSTGPNILAYNYFPNGGEMVIDTDNTGFYTAGNAVGFRNVVMHELGHGIGLLHTEPVNNTKLMEPFISSAYEGPQIDDIQAMHRHYGDAFEKSGGNDTSGMATFLGNIVQGGMAAIGTDADDVSVAMTDVDFISIDGTSDVDYLSFSVGSAGTVDLTLVPQGPTYLEGPQDGVNGNETMFDSSAQNDLALELLDTDGSTVLATANLTGLGGTESLSSIAVGAAGTYFARISGDQDEIQLYELSVQFVPEPSDPLWMMALSLVGIVVWKRPRK